MILYAVKCGDLYLRDRKEHGVELLGFDHCSVFLTWEEALKARNKYQGNDAELTEIQLTTKEIPWPEN